MVKLRHETSPFIAFEILRTQRFIAGPIGGDAGLNAEIVGHPTPYWAGQASGRGALLEFEWNGPVIRAAHAPHVPGVLFDEHPHRAFLLAGTREHLYLTDVQLLAGFRWHSSPPKLTNAPLTWVRSKLPGWLEREDARIAALVRERVSERPPVRIAMHPHAPYRSDFEEKYPGISLL